MDTATGRWVTCGRTNDTDMDVTGLTEGHDYQFRVKAVNEEGESEPLYSDKNVKAKNPYGKSRPASKSTLIMLQRGPDLKPDCPLHDEVF